MIDFGWAYDLHTCHQLEIILNEWPETDLNLFKFFINPNSYSQSVENLFFLSFLIKDGKAGIETEDEAGNPSDYPQVCRSLFVLHHSSQGRPAAAQIGFVGDHSRYCGGYRTRRSRGRGSEETVDHGADRARLEGCHRTLWHSRVYHPGPTKRCRWSRGKLRVVIHSNRHRIGRHS